MEGSGALSFADALSRAHLSNPVPLVNLELVVQLVEPVESAPVDSSTRMWSE